jgi:hypothetical protein
VYKRVLDRASARQENLEVRERRRETRATCRDWASFRVPSDFTLARFLAVWHIEFCARRKRTSKRPTVISSTCPRLQFACNSGNSHVWQFRSPSVMPEKVRDELVARAALQGKSMQEFLRSELERMAARPSVSAWLEQVRKRKRASATQVSSEKILRSREANRP